MRFLLLSVASLLAVAHGAPVSSTTTSTTTSVLDTWYSLTPSGTLPPSASGITSYDGWFALSIRTISASVSLGISYGKRDVVSQISDGQVQAGTKTVASTKTLASVVNQITDGQIQQKTALPSTAQIINQISDGQIQQQSKTTAAVVNQIGDGQIQQQTKTTANVVNQIGDGQIQQQSKTTASVVNQISDGQIQARTSSKTTSKTSAVVVSQISDGQIQAQTTSKTTSKTSASVVTQISDGQIQAQTTSKTSSKTSAGVVSEISDGQLQATSEASGEPTFDETCVASDSLTISIENGQLRDSQGRVGAIVANQQFQFDGPPPQAGTIYAAGWAFVPASYAGYGEKQSDTIDYGYKLALGNQTTFYKCLSGDFYNLYAASIGGQCSAIEIFVLEVVDC